MILARALIRLGVAALLAAGLIGCRSRAERSVWAASNPAGTARALLTVDTSRVPGSTIVRLRVLHGEALNEGLAAVVKRKVDWEARGCNVIYVFWLDDEELEIQLDPAIKRCYSLEQTTTEVGGVRISVKMPSTTRKRDVMKTTGESE
jgi:hypothetical protein